MLRERDKAKPFFVWVHYMDSHYPYLPPKGFLKDSISEKEIKSSTKLFYKLFFQNHKPNKEELEKIKKLYEEVIRYTDYNVGRLLEEINGIINLENTIIVLCSDHGDEFMEHGNTGHKEKLVPELLKIPLLIHNRGKKGIVGKNVSLVQLASTILEMVGIDYSKDMQPSLFDDKKIEVRSEMVTKYEPLLSLVNLNSFESIVHT